MIFLRSFLRPFRKALPFVVPCLLAPVPAAWAEEVASTRGGDSAPRTLSGPIPATVVRIVDGDTLEVRAHIWLGQSVQTMVRVDGIDTPELRGRCPAEKALAQEARTRVATLLPPGSPVALHGVTLGKFAGRVVARIQAADGTDLGASLIAAGLARAYDGGGRKPWCPN